VSDVFAVPQYLHVWCGRVAFPHSLQVTSSGFVRAKCCRLRRVFDELWRFFGTDIEGMYISDS